MKEASAQTMDHAAITLPAALNDSNSAQEPESPENHELNISGYWMLVAIGVAIIAMEPILWVVIRRWLFAV